MPEDGQPASLTITKVSNGFIVNIGNYGLSELKEPYRKETKIFRDFTELRQFQLEFFGDKK